VVHFSSIEKDGTKENISEQAILLYFVPYGKNYPNINAPILFKKNVNAPIG
jgi:hypothetical protein